MGVKATSLGEGDFAGGQSWKNNFDSRFSWPWAMTEAIEGWVGYQSNASPPVLTRGT